MSKDIVLMTKILYIQKLKRDKYSVKQMFRDYREGKNLVDMSSPSIITVLNRDNFQLRYAIDFLKEEMNTLAVGVPDDYINEQNNLEVRCLILVDEANGKNIAFVARPWHGDESGEWQYVLGDIEGYDL